MRIFQGTAFKSIQSDFIQFAKPISKYNLLYQPFTDTATQYYCSSTILLQSLEPGSLWWETGA